MGSLAGSDQFSVISRSFQKWNADGRGLKARINADFIQDISPGNLSSRTVIARHEAIYYSGSFRCWDSVLWKGVRGMLFINLLLPLNN
jgi:hypothetical protein